LKFASVGCVGNHVGLTLAIALPDLNAVATIQYTGKIMTMKTANPPIFAKTCLVLDVFT